MGLGYTLYVTLNPKPHHSDFYFLTSHSHRCFVGSIRIVCMPVHIGVSDPRNTLNPEP